jgi:hypothetical protein
MFSGILHLEEGETSVMVISAASFPIVRHSKQVFPISFNCQIDPVLQVPPPGQQSLLYFLKVIGSFLVATFLFWVAFTPPASAQAVTVEPPVPEERKVTISFSIPEVIDLSVSEAVISFLNVKDTGTYKAHKNAKLSVSTNASRWKIVCDPTPVQHTDNPTQVIPPERIRWELKTSGPQKMESSGSLGPSVILLEGNAPVKDLKIKISFFLEILPGDPAGDYTSSINMMGMVGF